MSEHSDTLEYDLIVIGAGMAGLSAAGKAAERGARVLVAEKGEEIGGSGQHALFLWTVADPRVLKGWDDGEPNLAKVVLDEFPEGCQCMRDREMLLSGPKPVLHGRGYLLNVAAHMQDCVKRVRAAGGHIITGAAVESLIMGDDGRVQGAVVADAGEPVEVRAPWTLLATGGYQADPGLRIERIHPNAERIALRSNPHSTGDGIRLGRSAGGDWAGDNQGFYGHLVSSPARLSHPSLFARLSQYHSDYSLLFNEEGKRFTDESQGDFRSSNELVFQPNARGLLIWDHHVHTEHVLKSFVYGVEPEDRLEVALQYDALGGKADNLEALEQMVNQWGFPGREVIRNWHDYNRKIVDRPEQLHPPRAYDLRPVDQPPYYAMVVEPAITFTHGGLRVDENACVLNADGRPIPGLLAAGADVGNVYNRGYAGGMALALGFALRAMRTAGWNGSCES